MTQPRLCDFQLDTKQFPVVTWFQAVKQVVDIAAEMSKFMQLVAENEKTLEALKSVQEGAKFFYDKISDISEENILCMQQEVDQHTNDEEIVWNGMQMAPHSFNLWRFIMHSSQLLSGLIKEQTAQEKTPKEIYRIGGPLEKLLHAAVTEFILQAIEKLQKPLVLEFEVPQKGVVMRFPVKH